jgi:hypothetical protein
MDLLVPTVSDPAVVSTNKRHIVRALRMMRKAHTNETKLEKIKNRILKSIPVPSLAPKYELHSSLYRQQGAFPKMKSLSELEAEARANYQVHIETARRKRMASKNIKPRRIYVDVVNKIKEEVRQARALETSKERNLHDSPSSLPPSSLHKKPHFFPEVSGLRRSYSESSINHSKHAAIPILDTHNLHNNVQVSFAKLSPRSPRSGLHTSPRSHHPNHESNHPHNSHHTEENRIHRFHANRELLDQEEKKTMRQIAQKAHDEERRTAQERLNNRVKSWHFIVKSFTAMNAAKEVLDRHRREQELRSNPLSLLSPHGRAIIDRWLTKLKIRLLEKRKPHYVILLRGVIMRFWCKVQLRKRRSATKVLISFLHECKLRQGYFRKIYEYRAKILKVQHYIRDWVSIQRARIELLYLAKDRIDKKRIEAERLDRLKVQRKAVLATQSYSGFSKTMSELKAVKSNFKRLVMRENEYMKHVQNIIDAEEEEKRILMQEILEEQAKYRPKLNSTTGIGHGNHVPSLTITALDVNHHNKQSTPTSTSTPRRMVNFRDGGAPSPRQNFVITAPPAPGVAQRRLTRRHIPYRMLHRTLHSPIHYQHLWYERAMRHPESRNKIESLRLILRAQRQRHMINRQMEENDMKYKMRKVDLKALKAFLKNPHENNAAVKSQAILTHDETADLVLKWNKRIRPVFLLLTQGGNDALQKFRYPFQH